VLWEDELGMGMIDRVMKFTYPYEYDEELREANRA
jgi:hypothetical protein